MFYLLHGDDEFTLREHLKTLKKQGDFGYNQDIFDGSSTELQKIIVASDTMPFLSEQRLIVVEGLPKKKGRGTAEADASGKATKGKRSKKSKGGAMTRAAYEKALAEYIAQLPDYTVLILLADETLEASHPLVKAGEKYGKVLQCTLPKGNALESWIKQRAKSVGVSITPDAVSLLANFIGNQLRLLANEIDKLATYVGDNGTITVSEIEKLSAQVQEAKVFDLTDALARRNRKQALNILHDLLSDGEPPIKLISLIISQVRSLLLVKELAHKGMRDGQIASTLGMAPFIAKKTLGQVNNFTPQQLENTYRKLLETDAALKRSRLTPEMALDMLILSFGV
ncbi:DNA polymerase III delta subunit [Thermosporothrix hazakensis]|jgi:DNA polymerase-3 subunit delta|uniref:DNA polymerase III subunit delta n=1 Tax=Thermosporothrix hazakensis TaxID=644383 RepID=A0A326TZ82_THEHA|nr:DNA polymerase III subunit delta [Thermosporothrix hazakensis]PZW22561.1 DNA polymerase III delta subunit [Thermosporothrix hazakensis]GCE48533.1 DNA polymerase III subunit delta [Thermosporothrix hazakensis]